MTTLRHIALLGLLTLTPAWADCAGEVIFACKIKTKTLELCLTADALRYTFGKGQPDLTITTPLPQLDYTPWNGIGRSMWEAVRFENRGVTYEVWSSIDKLMDENDPAPIWSGGVIVSRGDATLAQLVCTTPPEPPFIDVLYDAKTAVGQCWNFDRRAWLNCT